MWAVWSISLRTLRDRWTLFVGALLSVALGVALVQSSTVLLAAANSAHPAPGSTPAQARALRETVEGVQLPDGDLDLLVHVPLGVHHRLDAGVHRRRAAPRPRPAPLERRLAPPGTSPPRRRGPGRRPGRHGSRRRARTAHHGGRGLAGPSGRTRCGHLARRLPCVDAARRPGRRAGLGGGRGARGGAARRPGEAARRVAGDR